ncbi:hypothetical protein QQ44_20945 [Mycolicibacterium setense]|uniref:Uncharacterized protein n=1 Tax=Mycolicibacterium setense TaxID=431269 RepID=A0ABR4YRL3_9MYCO|nr:hypothetical protein QQ44_20945 [Mycolicibacterium setense]
MGHPHQQFGPGGLASDGDPGERVEQRFQFGDVAVPDGFVRNRGHVATMSPTPCRILNGSLRWRRAGSQWDADRAEHREGL